MPVNITPSEISKFNDEYSETIELCEYCNERHNTNIRCKKEKEYLRKVFKDFKKQQESTNSIY